MYAVRSQEVSHYFLIINIHTQIFPHVPYLWHGRVSDFNTNYWAEQRELVYDKKINRKEEKVKVYFSRDRKVASPGERVRWEVRPLAKLSVNSNASFRLILHKQTKTNKDIASIWDNTIDAFPVPTSEDHMIPPILASEDHMISPTLAVSITWSILS